jgi:hypothetical protein
MRGFQLRYVALVAGSLLVMLAIAGAHTLYVAKSDPLIQASMIRFFLVGGLYVLVVTLAAVFLSHRAVGPTRRIEEELTNIAEHRSDSHQLKVRDGDDFEGLVKAINRFLDKNPAGHRK